VGLRLTPEQIAKAAWHVTTVGASEGVVSDGVVSDGVVSDGVVSALLETARRVGSTGGGAHATKPSAKFADLVLPDSTLDAVRQLVMWARQRDAVLARNPRLSSGGKGRGISALFAGSPGTGKTLAAHVVADALKLDLYQVEIPTIIDKYIGETEKNLQRVFHEAESLNAVLFFDEADSLFGARSEVRDARDRYANIEVAYLLQRMEQFDGIAILATNLRGNLDSAFSRRLQFIVHFPDPDEPTRRRLWQQHLDGFEPLDPADPVDLDQLARSVEIAGGDIRNIVMAAAYSATDEDSPIGMRHVLVAVDRELRKLGRRVPAQSAGG
jgi:SpoVK/Ycf46/Vps4 family AAA+-type ATPase